ncbi:hypothetical protein T265_02227 [Opisthorchis viverrini]|uniref:C2H2-type domain-containing protein n=2 Tax=Opisthorchis viverrini TaxID=6198 RepID=A0A074ZWU9_OPIVI|nr:hypothetical protein T265_02227 [Opisthorchis viverrini]KER31591.1 hypothetical protein T265_02227 [Opisthorchis viverrini]
MKKEDTVTSECAVPEVAPEAPIPTPKRKRGRPPAQPKENEGNESSQQRAKRGRKSIATDKGSTPADVDNTPGSKRGRKKKTNAKLDTPNGSDCVSRAVASNRKSSVKAGVAGTPEPDSYSYTDLFPGDDEDQDEDIDAGDDDSEYAPSDEEMAHVSSAAGRRRGAAAGTRRQTRSKTAESQPDGSTDEDEAGESESEFDEDDEEEEDLTAEREELIDQPATNGTTGALFVNEGNQVQRDVYDFDAQSLLSNRVLNASKKRTTGAVSGGAGAGTAGGRASGQTTRRVNRRNATGAAPSWGSNIYSALAASLRTRADLDAYSDFLKSTVLNQDFDRLIAELCKPSSQHANLFYGVSASLQSLMSRINDYDKVVELVHACVARPLNKMRHRVACLAPVVHQPLLGLNYLPMMNTALTELAASIDQEMVIKPVYPLDPDINLLALTNSALGDFGVSPSQYNLITGSGNIGRFMPDIKQLVVPTELFNKLNDLISLPPERVYEVALSRVHQQTDESDIDISPIEPPDLQRLMLILNSEEVLLGMALLDSWNEEDIAVSVKETVLNLTKVSPSDVSDSEGINGSKCDTIQNEVADVLNSVINCAIMDASVDNPFGKRFGRSAVSNLGQIHFIDAFLLKPNGRRDHLLLVAHKANCYPPLNSHVDESEAFIVYSLLEEGHFLLERHGFAPDVPVELEGVHTADPEDLLDDQSLLVVPDLLYDTLRKVMLRELIRCTGAPTTVLNSKSDVFVAPLPVVQCTKFVVLDRVRRVPLALVFDSPVRLALQVFSDEYSVHPFGVEASKQFDQLTPAELKNTESAFKPTTPDYRLVTIGGLLYAVQIDDLRIVRRILEIIPARSDPVFPHSRRPSVCAQSVVGESNSCPASVQIVNDETNSSTVLPAFYYPQYDRKRYNSVLSGFSDHVCNLLYDLPIRVSLYDIMFRLGQKHMPELLARQHIEAAEAAAYAEAAANPHAPPPAPVPLPEHWGVCCMCSKELRSVNGLLDHEMRHIGLSRFRCVPHNTSFLDRRQWQIHMNEMHSTTRTPSMAAALPRIGHAAQADSGSEPEEEDEDVPGSGLLAGLTQVFSTGVLVGRMEAPQCEKCGDYFLNADVLTQHLDFCDGVSFSVRTPIPRTQKPPVDESSAMPEVDADENTQADETGELKIGSCVCGMCGAQLSSREKILRHFSSYHLQCIMCNSVLRSLEELSCHYKKHMAAESEAVPSTPFVKPEAVTDEAEVDTATTGLHNKTLLQKLMRCDLCQHFCGTKYNYYYHQWSEHGVVHPSLGSTDVVQQPRQLRQTNDREELQYSLTGVRRIKCKFCGLVVRVTGKEYIAHLSEKHGVFANAEVICRICAELFETPEHLSVHLGETHAPSGEFANAGVQTVFRCSQCEFWGFSKGMVKHAREAHGDINPAMYECPHCYERFTDKRCWRTHMDKHNEGYSQRCVECGRAFRLRASLLHHIRTHHGDDQGPATCEYCGMTYPRRASLRYHIYRMHNQELAHECTMCQRRFRVENELRRHVKEMHSGAVRCEICHKVCNNLRCYAQHRQKHFRTRIYQCTDCQTTFKSKLAMKRHIRVEHLQLGPEKFECQICGKIVTQIGMHMLIHKEARFECEYCGKRFTKAAYYNEHFRIHLGEQPFECHICQKRFNKKSNLNVHLKFHEKHRDEEGNYLELKPRGRVSTMFGDALLSPADRAARQAAAARNQNHPPVMADAAVGSDLPAAFNCAAGPPGAAAEAAARAIEMFGMDSALLNHFPISSFATDSNDGESYS